jgi:hypothetical protein
MMASLIFKHSPSHFFSSTLKTTNHSSHAPPSLVRVSPATFLWWAGGGPVTGKGVIERGTCLWFLRCEGQFCFKGLRVKPAENWFNDGDGIYVFGEVRMAMVHG